MTNMSEKVRGGGVSQANSSDAGLLDAADVKRPGEFVCRSADETPVDPVKPRFSPGTTQITGAAQAAGAQAATVVPSQQPQPSASDPANKLPPYRFAHASGETSKRYVTTPAGTFHLTPTELALVRTIEELDGAAISRADLAKRLHRNAKVVSRLISNLRREGVIESEPVYGENGAQLANRYRVSRNAVPMD